MIRIVGAICTLIWMGFSVENTNGVMHSPQDLITVVSEYLTLDAGLAKNQLSATT